MAVAFLAGTGGLAISTRLTVPTGAAVVLGASLCFFLTLIVGALKRDSLARMVRSPKTVGVVVAILGVALVLHALSLGDPGIGGDTLSLTASDIQHEEILGALFILAGGAYFKFGWPLRK
jgi:hypothetical protein